MEELIEYLNANHFVAENKYSRGGLKVAISKATELLQSKSIYIKKKEREAAEKVFNLFVDYPTTFFDKEDYLNQNYPI